MSDNDLIFPMSLDEEDAGGGSGHQQSDGDDSDCESLLSLEDKKKRSWHECCKETVLSLMADLSMGYDPSTLPQYAMSLFPLLWDNMFPGSFNHLLVLLFGSNLDMTRCQRSMHLWLDRNLQSQPSYPCTSTNAHDDALFGSEVEMVRRLVAPLRGEPDMVFWLNSRTFYAEELCREIECSAKVIEQFQHDLIASLVVPTHHDPVHGKMVIGKNSERLWGLRDYRLEASAATLGWESLNKSSIEFTKFHQYYKRHLCRTNYRKAVELGFMPGPNSNEFPKFILEGAEVTLPSWPCGKAQSTVLDLLFKAALWMGLARGFPALHLFCDMVRHFTFCEPGTNITEERARFLRYLVRVRVTSRAVRLPTLEPPFPFDDRTYADRNPAYFIDVAESRRRRGEELQETLSLNDRPRVPRHMAIGASESKLPPMLREDHPRRRNSIAGIQPIDMELKDTITEDLVDRWAALCMKITSPASTTSSNPIPIPKPSPSRNVFTFVDDMSHYNAW